MTVETLGEYGVERMADRAIDEFLSSQGVGVLALPGEDLPYLIPLSFGYDGESALYFTYVLGESSGKREATERSDRARFLVYAAESAFVWRSVLLTGTIEPVPEAEWESHAAAMENAWRPDLFESADADVELYRFAVTDRTGIRHAGLPPGFANSRGE
jgi:hypothetical protein